MDSYRRLPDRGSPMGAPTHIGLTGAAGAGKDTVARTLAHMVRGSAIVALADPLKRFCLEAFGFEEQQLWGSSERRAEPPPGRTGPSAREALQRLGTEWGRALDEDVWVRLLMRRVDDLCRELVPDHLNHTMERCRLVITPDVRFPNEAAAIRAAGGQVWLVDRPGTGPPPAGVEDHVSEAGVTHWAVVVDNAGTLKDLHRMIHEALPAVMDGGREA